MAPLRQLAASAVTVFALLVLTAPARGQAKNLVTKNYSSEWTRIAIPPTHTVSNVMQWHIDPATRTIVCDGNGGHEWLRFNRQFADFRFHVEWRFTKLGGNPHYNSGVFFRNDADGIVWHQAQTTQEGGYLFGATLIGGKKTSFNLMKEMTEDRIRPPGEWNAYDIDCRKNTCTLAVNGPIVNTLHTDVLKGYVGLESEGFQIEFRNIELEELR
jgi:Icc-related predicted phosphoesterase